MVLYVKIFQEYSGNAIACQGFTINSMLFVLYINYLCGDAICNIVVYVADATLYSKDCYSLTLQQEGLLISILG